MASTRWPNWAVVLAVFVGSYLYLRSPIDLLPDVLGIFGYLDDLILIGIALWWLQERLATPAPVAAAPIPTDPYELLGIGPDASPEAITRAYREQLKRYHPDRVAGLGDELQRVAHERTIAIQRAYAALRGR